MAETKISVTDGRVDIDDIAVAGSAESADAA